METEAKKQCISVYKSLTDLAKCEKASEGRRAYKVATKDKTFFCVASGQSSALNAVGKFIAKLETEGASVSPVGVQDYIDALREESNG